MCRNRALAAKSGLSTWRPVPESGGVVSCTQQVRGLHSWSNGLFQCSFIGKSLVKEDVPIEFGAPKTSILVRARVIAG